MSRQHKLAVLRGHCDAVGRDYDAIEKTRIQPWLLARDAAALAVKRERLATNGPSRGFVGTVSEAIAETRDIFASDVMPHFA